MSQSPAWILREGKRKQWERRLLAEFLRKEYPTTPYTLNARLGALPPEYEAMPLTPAQARALTPKKRYADALIYLPAKSILVESKMKAQPGIISLLEVYAKLFIETPDLRERWNLPLELMLVYVVGDPVTVQLAREKRIRCIQHIPSWIDQWIKSIAEKRRAYIREALELETVAPGPGGG